MADEETPVKAEDVQEEQTEETPVDVAQEQAEETANEEEVVTEEIVEEITEEYTEEEEIESKPTTSKKKKVPKSKGQQKKKTRGAQGVTSGGAGTSTGKGKRKQGSLIWAYPRKPAKAPSFSPCPHRYFKRSITDRSKLNRQKYTDLLAAPRREPWKETDIEELQKFRRRLITPRTECLALPSKRYVKAHLQEYSEVLTPQMIKNLEVILDTKCDLTAGSGEIKKYYKEDSDREDLRGRKGLKKPERKKVKKETVESGEAEGLGDQQEQELKTDEPITEEGISGEKDIVTEKDEPSSKEEIATVDKSQIDDETTEGAATAEELVPSGEEAAEDVEGDIALTDSKLMEQEKEETEEGAEKVGDDIEPTDSKLMEAEEKEAEIEGESEEQAAPAEEEIEGAKEELHISSLPLREWAKWLQDSLSRASLWAGWIEGTVAEAEVKAAKKKGTVLSVDGKPKQLTRKEWNSWKEQLKVNVKDWRNAKQDIQEAAHMWENFMQIRANKIKEGEEFTVPNPQAWKESFENSKSPKMSKS